MRYVGGDEIRQSTLTVAGGLGRLDASSVRGRNGREGLTGTHCERICLLGVVRTCSRESEGERSDSERGDALF